LSLRDLKMKDLAAGAARPIRATLSALLRITARRQSAARRFAQPVFISAADRIGTNRHRVLAPTCLFHTPAALS
jgi:hypothetical protein